MHWVTDNSCKTNECSSRQSDRKASECCTLVIRRKLWRPCRMVSRWFHDMLMVSRYYAACFERPLNLFEHNTISGLGQCRDGSNINTSSQCQCLSQDLHFFFFKKRSYLICLGSYLQKRAVIHQRRNCSMRRVNRLEAFISHAQNIQNKKLL